jgi:hypothetical protein
LKLLQAPRVQTAPPILIWTPGGGAGISGQDVLRFLKLADQALTASEQLVELWEEKLLRLIEKQLPPPIRVPGNDRLLDQLRAVLCELGVQGLPPASEC